MGVFFKTEDSIPVLKSVIGRAIKLDPTKVLNFDLDASEMAAEVIKSTPKAQFSWGRLGVAIAILILLGGFGIWSATIPSLDAWSKLFLHSFEMLFGGVMGLLGVESATN